MLGPAAGVVEGYRAAANRVAEECDLALGERVDAGDEVENRGLTRAVGTDQPENLPLFDVKRNVAYGGQTAETLGNVIHAEDDLIPNPFRHHAAPFLLPLKRPANHLTKRSTRNSLPPMSPFGRTIMMMITARP